jgi:hypothetical protein
MKHPEHFYVEISSAKYLSATLLNPAFHKAPRQWNNSAIMTLCTKDGLSSGFQ